MKRRSKYGNTITDGYHSKREAGRANYLRTLVQIGEITDLREQVKFEVIPKQDGERAAHYVCDFAYRDASGELVIEDVKSPATKTAAYILKRKLLLYVHGIRVREV